MTRLPVLFYLAVTSAVGTAQEFHPSIPRAWDDSETTSFELPLAQADRSPRYPSAKEYYNMPVRPVYRTYPFYAPDKEPAGYWESLQQKEPEVVFDPAKLKTKEDWIRAGKLVFDQPVAIVPPQRERYQANYRAIPHPTRPEGIVPGPVCVVRKKGVVEFGAAFLVRQRLDFVAGLNGPIESGKSGIAPWFASWAGLPVAEGSLRGVFQPVCLSSLLTAPDRNKNEGNQK